MKIGEKIEQKAAEDDTFKHQFGEGCAEVHVPGIRLILYRLSGET